MQRKLKRHLAHFQLLAWTGAEEVRTSTAVGLTNPQPGVLRMARSLSLWVHQQPTTHTTPSATCQPALGALLILDLLGQSHCRLTLYHAQTSSAQPPGKQLSLLYSSGQVFGEVGSVTFSGAVRDKRNQWKGRIQCWHLLCGLTFHLIPHPSDSSPFSTFHL